MKHVPDKIREQINQREEQRKVVTRWQPRSQRRRRKKESKLRIFLVPPRTQGLMTLGFCFQ